MRIFRLCLLVAVVSTASRVHGQASPPVLSPSALHSALLRLRKEQLPEWRRVLNSVEVEQLPIAYADGKLIERMRDQSLQWTQIVQTATNQALETNSLLKQIQLAYEINELNHSLSDLSSQLSYFSLPSGPKEDLRIKWARELQDLAGGPINTLTVDIQSFAEARADRLESRCRP